MRQKQHGEQPNAWRQPSRGADVLLEALQNQRTISAQPERVRKDHNEKKDQRDPRLRMKQGCATARRQWSEDDEQDEKDQPRVACEHEQSENKRKQEPVTAAPLAEGTPIVKQRQGPQGCSEYRRTEVRARHRECGNAHHQQHGKNRVAYADDCTAEPKHRPISEDDTSLRQSIEPEGPCDPEGYFTEPECQRWTKIAAEHEFVPYGQQH